jgi:ferric-dicitrate binding protein FerR (iron transport regulator)
MPIIGGRFYSSWESYSPYTAMQMQRSHMAEARQQDESNISALVGSLGDAAASSSQGLAQLAAQRAADRLNAETKANAAKAAAAANLPVESDVIPSTYNSAFSVTSSVRLDGGSQINLDAGTMTMKDGSVYDLTTGLKKINITT